MTDFRVIIPARYASERLPGKPLSDLGGKPMVVRCWEAAMEAGATEVIVAADDERILRAVTAAGAHAVMTDPSHASGTDRIAEVAKARGWSEDAIVVNMQGDEPQLPPLLLQDLARALALNEAAGIATMATPIRHHEDVFKESVVKVITDQRGHAMIFTRAPVPWVRGEFGAEEPSLPTDVPLLRHLGLYAYRVRTLHTLSGAPRAPIERAESLEQLRALYMGIAIHVTVIDEAPPHGVDTPDDLERVRRSFES